MVRKKLLVNVTSVSLGLLLLVGVSLPILPAGAAAETVLAQTPTKKKKIAIVDFDFANTSDSGYWYNYRGGGAARGISELLTNKLVNDGTFIVTSRSAMENYLRDQGLSSNNIDEAAAVKIGKALGVDAVIVGTVTRFNVETKRGGGGIFGIGASSEKTKAVVQLTVRAVDPQSQSIVAAMEGLGESESNSTNVTILGAGGSGGSSGTDEILSKASDDAITKVVTQMKTKL